MDWGSILTIVLGILAAIGLPLALRSRGKGGQKKVQELWQHLQGIGVKASMFEKGTGQEKLGQKRSWGQKSVGIIKLTDRNIDSISVVGVASQYGVNYYLDYLVRKSSIIGIEKKKKTRMITKKSSLIRGKVIDIEWRGDNTLAQKLNFDYRLKDKLLQAAPKGSIEVFPEPKYEYARIRTTYFLPTPDLLEDMDIIAEHLKSWY
ncbi:MAG TPA: hypothetical protein G4O12_07280 [Dehalococcoidia bacterium]|nr:hypothetical protein [Dehalococcoidia bacterium]